MTNTEKQLLLAKFIGAKTGELGGEKLTKDEIWLPYFGLIHRRSMKFDTNWNWIMKVLDKINEIPECYTILEKYTFCIKYSPMNLYNQLYSVGSYNSKIQMVFEGCVEFVQKYNHYVKVSRN